MTTTTTATPEGFEAMGKPVPMYRLTAALEAVREMVPDITTEAGMRVVGRVADELGRDQPYRALEEARQVLDLTGAYRLVATTLCAQKVEAP